MAGKFKKYYRCKVDIYLLSLFLEAIILADVFLISPPPYLEVVGESDIKVDDKCHKIVIYC